MRSILFVGLIVVFTLCGCAHAKRTQQPEKKKISVSMQNADNALAMIFCAYKAYEPATFERLISAHFAPDRLLFLGLVDSGFSSGTLLDIQYTVTQATQKETNLDVVFSWKKKKIPYSKDNEPLVQKGKTEFIFEKTADAWLLAETKGDNPF